MTSVVQTWQKRATIGGTVTSFLDGHASFAVRQIGTCDLTIPLPLPENVTLNAGVTLEASLDGVWLAGPLFTGTVRSIEPSVSSGGATTTVHCEGDAYRLAYPVGRLAHAGGAKSTPQTVVSPAHHIGTATITWYADDVGEGTAVDFTVTPSTDSNFVWLAGKIHGSNSYDASVGDKKTKAWSKVDVYQAGEKLGYANLPTTQEQYTDHLDYTDIGNWEDFEVYIAAPIVAADGTVTFRFRSGKKPGTSTNDDYEVQSVTWQTAGRQTVRAIVRGLMRRAGVPSYDVNEITDLDGSIIKLGGNGYVDAGQIIIDRREQPLSWIARVLELFGFVLFDSPDGTVRVRPLRGEPSGTPAVTFVEQVNVLGVPRLGTDPSNVYNVVRVEGASGNTAAGSRFAYLYQTDPGLVLDNPYVPDPPGTNLLVLSSSLLTSNTLCQQAGEVSESIVGSAETIDWETWPHVLRPAQVVQVTAPTVGFDALVFVQSIRYDIDSSGYRMSCSGWVGSPVAVSETPDSNPSEVDTEPVDPRPDDEWQPYSPLATVQ